MLTIRLSRVGKRKQPVYRFIVSEKARDPWGSQLEILGHYNPRTNPPTFVVKSERLQHWISKGAQLSDTVNNLLIDKQIIKGDKRRIVKMSQKRKAASAEAAAQEAKTNQEDAKKKIAEKQVLEKVEEQPVEAKVTEPEKAVETAPAEA